ncbi:hypothetical protein RhiirC2_793814 [Rhizophagus irregularis]|uniref:Uncharacterized protein n=1 Tax=Rhizophagus irregularis TaxID=588596 RepID=A0A2N1MEX9_9GLOM|nr:hypothetical protein RhiirC2_793814 [Rhizophagus irregularis]
MPVIGMSGSGKTNILANLFVGDKGECICKGKEGGSRYIACDDLIVCGYHPDEHKWAFVRYIYGMISKDPKAPYYENIRFSYISPEKIPSVRAFSPERSTVIVFEDICLAPEYIQNQISQFFGNGRHRNISCVYVTQKYHKIPTFIRENSTHLVLFNSGSSHEDISKIIRRYTDDVKNASMVINSYLRKAKQTPIINIDPQKAHDLDWHLALQKIYYCPEGLYQNVKGLWDAFAEAFKSIYDNPDKPLNWPRKLQCDKGTEFMGYVTLLMNEHDVEIRRIIALFNRISPTYWQECERFARRIVDNMNDTPTRLIGMSPNDATKLGQIYSKSSVKYNRPIGINEPQLPKGTTA